VARNEQKRIWEDKREHISIDKILLNYMGINDIHM
jgi:hypothetical protein